MNRDVDMMQEERQEQGPGEEASLPKQEDASPSPETGLQARIDELEKQAALYKDQLLRKAAELENFKKRIENETAQVIRFANEDLLLAILPVVDDLERSLKNAENTESAFYKGVDLIRQKLLTVLQKQNVKPFDSVGKPFDVKYHDALLQVHGNTAPPHTVLEEIEKGYLYHDKVLRHAKVVVSSDQTDQPGTENGADAEGTGSEQ